MSVPTRGIARHLVLAGSVAAGLLGTGAAALAAPAPAPVAGQTIPASCGDAVTASPGDTVRISSRTGKPYDVPVTAKSPSSQVWRAGVLCEVRVNVVQRPVAAAAPAAVVPLAPAAGTVPAAGALPPTAPVAPVAPAPALRTAPAAAPSAGQRALLTPGGVPAAAPGAALGSLPTMAPGVAPAPAPGAVLPPVVGDPSAAVTRAADGRPDTGDAPSDVPLVLGALGVGAAAAAAIRYRMLHRRMTDAQPAPAPVPAPPAPAVVPAAQHAEDVTRFAAAPIDPSLAETAFVPRVEEGMTVLDPFADTAFVEPVPAGRL
ncbi:hypothetical protein [Actinomycetospora termitidis]|uniref:Uncharacterized protein n=1 Tax=Actinomycetospora termitidis TaxID=3053470 RepID=A0ABT7MGI8_9PSEU|nr:hypothetical protein [Actinomycetospora sp. Odt1-22]MDL5159770.1 hypothetical protein [Actinomycetospora sp. Odt1-22]